MDFRPASLKLPLPVFLAVAMVLSAGAQQASQPIIFSSAQSGDVAPSTPSLSPDGTKQPKLADTSQAPPPGFNFNAPSDNEPLPQMPAASSAEDQRLQRILEERKNWALMTPQEIFGVQTPEEILGVKQRDAFGREINTTQVERYLARQNQPQAAATNGWQNAGTAETENLDFSGNQQADRFNADGGGRQNVRQFLNSFLNSTPDNDNAPGGQSATTDWPRPFDAAALPKTNPQQQADMNDFSQLLKSPSDAATAATQSGSAGKFLPAPTTTEDSILGQPVVNPIGGSFTPLSGGIGMPEKVTPLARITSQNNNSQPVAAPSWTPQPAPWLSQTPQPFTVPQRQF